MRTYITLVSLLFCACSSSEDDKKPDAGVSKDAGSISDAGSDSSDSSISVDAKIDSKD
jgi:hypothetical protein